MITKKNSLIAGMTPVVALALSACSGPAPIPAIDANTPITVTVAPAAMADIADTFESGGAVQARTTAVITARILAPVLEVRVAPGDRVRAGQTLVVLDGRDLAAHARSARAAVEAAVESAAAAASEQRAADAALLLARTTHQRIAELQAKRSATAQELDDVTGASQAAEARAAGAAARAQAARAALESARASSEAAATTESFAILEAPFAGVVTQKMVEPGNTAAPGLPLLRLEDTGAFTLDVRVDEARVGAIVAGMRVPVTIDSGSGGPTALSGVVAEVSRAVDADARAFLVKVALPDSAGLRSGTFARVRFTTGTRRALAVPPGAVTRRGQVASVFVVEPGANPAEAGDGRVARLRLVDVSGSEVLAGLTEGERVILNPPPTLADGRRVSEGERR